MEHPTKALLCRNGFKLPASITNTQLIGAFPRGTYTSARTINLKVLEYPEHVGRLLGFEPLAAKFTPLTFDALLRPYLKATMHYYAKEAGLLAHPTTPPAFELRITLLVTQSAPTLPQATAALLAPSTLQIHAVDLLDPNLQLYVLIDPMPQVPRPPIAIDSIVAARDSPAIKHTGWVQNRAVFERAMSPGANEVLLRDEHGKLYEGLSSNFFVLDDEGRLVTAPEGTVLAGTIRKIVLLCCAELSIPIVMALPDLAEAQSWKGCFISSTSRLLLPVDSICVKHRDGSATTLRIHNTTRVLELQLAVLNHLSTLSTDILELK